jgi:23S rRNA (adenine2503-C2)-methyltransferase
MIDIRSMTTEALEGLMESLGEPKYRAGQVFGWLHAKHAESFAEMSNLPASARAALDSACYIDSPALLEKQASPNGTVKFLFGLKDGNRVESVLMAYRHGNSLCVSTQAGCKMGCAFCASTLAGLARDLSPAEMLGQVYAAEKHSGARVSSIVLMGIGEPLDNYDNTLAFLKLISHKNGQNLSLRHVSLSTCGLVDKIDRLAEEKLGLTLSVSLHAAEDKLRSSLMPINRRWGAADLIAACKRYFKATGRRISFEYALIDGVNDTPAHAKALVARLKGFPCHVNLIPLNEVKERGWHKSPPKAVAAFQAALTAAGLNATVRRELGTGISAACGQLRHNSTLEVMPE